MEVPMDASLLEALFRRVIAMFFSQSDFLDMY